MRESSPVAAPLPKSALSVPDRPQPRAKSPPTSNKAKGPAHPATLAHTNLTPAPPQEEKGQIYRRRLTLSSSRQLGRSTTYMTASHLKSFAGDFPPRVSRRCNPTATPHACSAHAAAATFQLCSR